MKHQRHIPGIVTVLASVGLVLRVASPIVVLFAFAPLPIFQDHPVGGFEYVAGLQEWALTPIVVGEGSFPRGEQQAVRNILQSRCPRVQMAWQFIVEQERQAVRRSRSLNHLHQQIEPLVAQERLAFLRCRRGRRRAESGDRCSI